MSDRSNSGPSIPSTSSMLHRVAVTTAVMTALQQAPPSSSSTAPAVPSFKGSDATEQFAGRPLPAIFPTADPKVIISLSPLELPRLLSPLTARESYAAPPGSTPAAQHTLALKHFPTFHSLLRPLSRYFEVLGAFVASSGGNSWEVFAVTRASTTYISHLADLNQHYKWAAVVAYHVEFHAARLQQMKDGEYSGWTQPDLELLSRFVWPSPRHAIVAAGRTGRRNS